MTLPRGFRAESEREAIRLRKKLKLDATEPLDVLKLANVIGVKVISAEKLVNRKRLEELEAIQSFSFSAATFEVGERHFIVTNPLRSKGRISSDVAHELAHVLLKHDLSEIRELDGIAFRTCRPDEEEQATSFGGTILLPRPILVSAARRGLSPDEIANEHNVTTEMARFRFNSTGVAKQVKRYSN